MSSLTLLRSDLSCWCHLCITTTQRRPGNHLTDRKSVAAVEHTCVFFFLTAGGEGDITWQKDGKEIDDEERVSKIDEVSSKLEIQNATLEDAGSYTCLCTFDNGDPDGRTSTNIYVYGETGDQADVPKGP